MEVRWPDKNKPVLPEHNPPTKLKESLLDGALEVDLPPTNEIGKGESSECVISYSRPITMDSISPEALKYTDTRCKNWHLIAHVFTA